MFLCRRLESFVCSSEAWIEQQVIPDSCSSLAEGASGDFRRLWDFSVKKLSTHSLTHSLNCSVWLTQKDYIRSSEPRSSPFRGLSEGCGHQAVVVGEDTVSTNEDKRVEDRQAVTLHSSPVSSPRNSDKPTHTARWTTVQQTSTVHPTSSTTKPWI